MSPAHLGSLLWLESQCFWCSSQTSGCLLQVFLMTCMIILVFFHFTQGLCHKNMSTSSRHSYFLFIASSAFCLWYVNLKFTSWCTYKRVYKDMTFSCAYLETSYSNEKGQNENQKHNTLDMMQIMHFDLHRVCLLNKWRANNRSHLSKDQTFKNSCPCAPNDFTLLSTEWITMSAFKFDNN